MQRKKIVIVGGSSGIGLATAKLFTEQDAEVIIAGRTEERLQQALNELKNDARAIAVDMMSEGSIKFLFEEVGNFDHLIISASEPVFGNFLDLEIDKAKDF